MTLQEPRPRPRPARRLRGLAAVALVLVALAAGVTALMLARSPAPLSGGPPSEPPGLGDYWSGRASLVLDKKWTSASLGVTGASGAYSGSHVEVVRGTWYLFNRRTTDVPCPGREPTSRQTGTEVRASTDRGATWGAPVAILTAEPGTPWSCVASDGDAVFDERTDTWRYLFQCEGGAPGWHGCYAERRGASPLGPFAPSRRVPNPVITPGLLWGRICDDAGDECLRAPGQPPIADEGTFNVVRSDDDGWWVGFHGWDGSQGLRGIARTTSFKRGDWQVDGAGGTPTDAVLDARDAAGWRETWAPGGPVGAGAASMLADDGWHYLLAEVPDMSLGCTTGQNWNLGLFRAQAPSSTEWEQYPGGNPIVYSSREPDSNGSVTWCNVHYPGLFEDPATGTTYLMHGRISDDPANDGIYVYRLEWDRNALFNGDFWRADAHGWKPRADAPAQLSVDRDPDGSPDGTPYLSFSCGAPTCDAGPSLYQDVTVDPELAGDRVAFGGSFRTDVGDGGLDAAVLELGPAGEVIDGTVVNVAASGEYAQARGELEVDRRARRLRFELYPRTPGTLRADNLYLITQDGCDAPRYPAC